MTLKTVKLPKRYNYAEAYLTLRCNLGCTYCINAMSGKIVRERNELTSSQWAEGLNRIDFGDIPLTFGGGEPTLYKNFFSLFEQLNSHIKLDLLTNLEFDIKTFIQLLSPEKFNNSYNPAYKSIRVSFHAEKMDSHRLIDKVEQLQEAGFTVGLFGLNHPRNVEHNMIMTELARERKIFFFVKDFLGKQDHEMFGYYKYPKALDGIPKHAKCRTRELLIGPEGNIYRCHRDLYKAEDAIGNIADQDLEIGDSFRPCNNYGKCNPCDVKLKTNRFLQMGNCSVEIVDSSNDG